MNLGKHIQVAKDLHILNQVKHKYILWWPDPARPHYCVLVLNSLLRREEYAVEDQELNST